MTYPGAYYHDESVRKEWQDPEIILSAIGLGEGDVFVDVGCGDGFFALPAARRVGPEGTVIGIDINPQALKDLSSRASPEERTRIRLIRGRAEEIIACASCATVVFYGICLHDFEDPAAVLQNARKMIGPGGRLVDLDWKAKPMDLGPSLSKRFPVETARTLIEAAGFGVRTVRDAGPYHYCIIASPRFRVEDDV